MMETIQYNPIGIISSPYKDKGDIPRQARATSGVKGTIEIFDEFSAGLNDLDGFSHIVVIFHLHMVKKPNLRDYPPVGGKKHGVFATRSPYRPNPIGLSVVRLKRIERNILHIEGLDMADGTPVLDIKPYVPELNPTKDIRTGWLSDKGKGMNKSKASRE